MRGERRIRRTLAEAGLVARRVGDAVLGLFPDGDPCVAIFRMKYGWQPRLDLVLQCVPGPLATTEMINRGARTAIRFQTAHRTRRV